MSLREELNRAIDAADHYDRHGVMPTWARMALTKFVGNHGQALLEALEDGVRGKWVIDHAAWIRRDGLTFMEIKLPAGVNLSSYGLRRDAIDAAIKGDGSKPFEGINDHRGDPESPVCT